MRYITSDLAKLMGVSTNTIRRYEESGFLSPKRDVSNYRWYEGSDLSRLAIIRLYIKCGFSHEEIREILDSDNDHMLNICTDKLAELDRQMERLKRLRHWLKDNIQLMNTLKDIGLGFTLMECPALWYIVSEIDGEILNEKGRFEAIKTFMYDAPEVQYMSLYRLEDIKKDRHIAHHGLALKEIDVEKFNLRDFIHTSPYVQYYPSRLCMYGTLSVPVKEIHIPDITEKYRQDYSKRADEFMEAKGLTTCGDVMLILVNTLSDTAGMLVCTPVEKIH